MTAPARRTPRALAAWLALWLAMGLAGPCLPEAQPADAPEGAFSGGRAFAHLEELARAPHPAGSAEHDRVRDAITAAFEQLGLETEVQRGERDGAALENLVVRWPGATPGGPTLLLVAHYDTTPLGPGAGDDSAGVAVLIEVARALRGPAGSDWGEVIVLLSDGEELGRLGAELFAAEHPSFESVDLVIDVEAAGNAGPARLIQLGPGGGARVQHFGLAVPRAFGSSLARELTALLPNTTDFEVFEREGKVGYDLVLCAGSAAYHAPDDLPQYLDPRALQHLGDTVLALARGPMAVAGDGAERTWFDLHGWVWIDYPQGLDTLIGLLAVALVLVAVSFGSLRGHLTTNATLAGLVLFPVKVLAVASAGFGLAWLLERGAGLVGEGAGAAGALWAGNLAVVGSAFLGLAGEQAWLGRGRRAPEVVEGRLAGGLVFWALGAMAALALAPGSVHLVVWPLGFAAGALLVRWRLRSSPGRRDAALALLVLPALVLLPPTLWALVQLASLRLPLAIGVGAGLTSLAGAALGPVLAQVAGRGGAPVVGLAGTGAALVAASALVAQLS